MPDPAELNDESMEVAAAISRTARSSGHTVAVAESLTSGAIASHLGASEASSEWFAGGVVAYAKKVKFDVLAVAPGPVVTDSCARQMASGVARLTSADLAVAVTGVGGPDPEEGKPAGTVFIAVSSRTGVRSEEFRFDGDPTEVVRATTLEALRMLAAEGAALGPTAG
ncbi:MAG: CinA domain protein [Cryobacterium sp.]|jgi:nicotinamide-nucleotide amidase|nr:CinA domain protein [Cryobacterium sp.]